MQNSGLFGTQSELTKCGVGCCNPILSKAGLHYLSCQKHLDMYEIKKKSKKTVVGCLWNSYSFYCLSSLNPVKLCMLMVFHEGEARLFTDLCPCQRVDVSVAI